MYIGGPPCSFGLVFTVGFMGMYLGMRSRSVLVADLEHEASDDAEEDTVSPERWRCLASALTFAVRLVRPLLRSEWVFKSEVGTPEGFERGLDRDFEFEYELMDPEGERTCVVRMGAFGVWPIGLYQHRSVKLQGGSILWSNRCPWHGK